MIAYKFLSAAGAGRFSDFVWPLPSGGQPGAFIRVEPPLSACARGLHACRAASLPYWLDELLWEVELRGEVSETETLVLAERARLLGRIDRWNADAKAAFMDFCVGRAQAHLACVEHEGGAPERERARFFVSNAESFRAQGEFATTAYVAAVAAHVGSALGPEAAYAAERAAQGAWLASLLGLG